MSGQQQSQEDWRKNIYEKSRLKNGERRKSFATDSGIEIQPVYPQPTPDQILEKCGLPGQFPFTRGVQPTMYRGRFWTMRQYSGFGTALETNKRFRYLLEQGQTGLSVAFDLPTQIGYDPDHELCLGEVGKVGVSISTLADIETLFDKIPVEKVTTSMTINATASILLAMYATLAKKRGISLDRIGGTVQNDILKEYSTRGTYRFPPNPSMRLTTDIFEFCAQKVPNWNTISISGYHIREAGCTAAQEIAFTLANGIAYVQAAISKGLDVDDFGGRLSFFFNGHNHFFEEIAKFRAARRMWAGIMKNRFGAKQDRSMMLRFHTQTAGSMLTSQQPDNNIVRVTMQALAAVLGGTQSLHTNGRDEALALPTEESARIALRTQQIIAHESGVTDSIDPLGGCPLIESLTDELAEKATAYIKRIDDMGGAVRAIEQGFVQKEIQKSAYAHQQAVEKKDKIIVGVNEYRLEGEKPPSDLLKIDDKIRAERIREVAEVKAGRNTPSLEKALAELQRAATDPKENLLPHIMLAVEEYASIGEICERLKRVFGEYEGSFL